MGVYYSSRVGGELCIIFGGKKAGEVQRMRSENILYAEDDPSDVIIFSMAFKRAMLSAELYTVDDGQAAEEWLSRQAPAGRFDSGFENAEDDRL